MWTREPSETELKGLVVWITGASSGIGEELAYQLAKCGSRLILSARRVDELNRVKQRCVGERTNFKPFPFCYNRQLPSSPCSYHKSVIGTWAASILEPYVCDFKSQMYDWHHSPLLYKSVRVYKRRMFLFFNWICWRENPSHLKQTQLSSTLAM